MIKDTTKEKKSYRHLTIEEREEVAIGCSIGLSIVNIAKANGRHRSTLYRELKRNKPPLNEVKYRANRAQIRSDERKKTCHQRERLHNELTRNYVEEKIRKGWTPELIAGRLKEEKSDLGTNYESIYLWIYTERNDLIDFLPRGHKKRRKRGSAKGKRAVKIPNRTMISERPDIVSKREEPGHWEADTAVSRQSKEAISAITERVSRFLIAKVLNAKTAENMNKAITASLKKQPKEIRISITYDNGTENAFHERTNDNCGTKSYFCNPYHSWEKGSIENRIGMIRRYYPKKTNWGLITQDELDTVVKEINTRPMKCLGFKTPEEVFVALTH